MAACGDTFRGGSPRTLHVSQRWIRIRQLPVQSKMAAWSMNRVKAVVIIYFYHLRMFPVCVSVDLPLKGTRGSRSRLSPADVFRSSGRSRTSGHL